jgi:hypothetical protein
MTPFDGIMQQGPFDGWDIQTTDAVADAHRRCVVRDLLGWRRQRDMKEWKNSTAKSTSTDREWQRQFGRGRILICSTSAATKVEGDLSVILADPMVKAFLPLKGITRSSDLFRGLLKMGRAFIDWNVNKSGRDYRQRR